MDIEANTEVKTNVIVDDWASFELYLKQKGVTEKIIDVLTDLLDENPWPENVDRYIYKKLGGETNTNIMKEQLNKLNRRIETVSYEIEYLSLIRNNGLKFSLYKDFVNRKQRQHANTSSSDDAISS